MEIGRVGVGWEVVRVGEGRAAFTAETFPEVSVARRERRDETDR